MCKLRTDVFFLLVKKKDEEKGMALACQHSKLTRRVVLFSLCPWYIGIDDGM